MHRPLITAALFAIASIAPSADAQQVRVSEPVVRYASPRLLVANPFTAMLVQTSEGEALLWHESIDLSEQTPASGDRKLLFAPIGRDGYADLDAMKAIEGTAGPAAVATDGRNILIATRSGMQVLGARGEFRDSFAALAIELAPYSVAPISAAIVDGEYRSALLDSGENGALVIRHGRFGPEFERNSSRWYGQDPEGSVFTGAAGTVVAVGGQGCPLIFSFCREGLAVNIYRDGAIKAWGSLLYRDGEPARSPAIASDGRELLMVWPASAPNCGANNVSPLCNAIRFGRVGLDARALDSSSGFLGNTRTVRAGATNPAIAATWTGRQYLVVWESTSDGVAIDLYGAFISAAGQVTATFPVAATDRSERQPSISITQSGQAIVTYISGPEWRVETRTVNVAEPRGRAVRR